MKPSATHPVSPGRFRWRICALLFFATTVNYLDRAVFSVLAPELEKVIGWTDRQFGDINAAFTLAYAIGLLFMGWFLDRVGTRWGYASALLAWSAAAIAHALMGTPLGFGFARFFLGLAEAGNFPAAVKTTAEWFPRRERALATGWFNAGSNVGAILAPLLAPAIALRWGWPWAFILTGGIGLAWVLLWLPMYRVPEKHPRLRPSELAWIRSDGTDAPGRVSWRRLWRHRQTWAFALGKLLTDPVWWFYLFWSGKFLADQFGVRLKTIGLPLVTIFLLADVGSVAGGWFSSHLLKRGWTPNAARKTAMLACALCVTPVCLAPVASNLWCAVLLIGVAAAAHQGFSANLFTLTTDMFPQRAVASVVGIGGLAGALGGMLTQAASGRIKEATGSYWVMFLAAALVYLAALGVVHWLAPRLEPARLRDEPPPQNSERS
jgi:ACS family hexuronate transporter-like MFS transporter